MFAVIKTGGRQYRVVPDDVLEITKIPGDVGTIVQLGDVMVVGGDTPILGGPFVKGASVAAEVLDHKRGPKVISFKKRRRKNSKRKRGYRDEITLIRVTEILTDGKAPSIGPRPKRAKVEKPVDADGETDASSSKKSPAKKPAAKKAAATKTSKAPAKTEKAPAKKAPAKKPAAKKADK